jgi:hypothetical protein
LPSAATLKLNQTLDESFLSGAAAVTGVLIFALPIYYVWTLVAFFRRQGVLHWPPAVCLGLWLLQWPFAIVSAVGCLGGGCAGDPKHKWLLLLGILAYNFGPAYWRSATQAPQ